MQKSKSASSYGLRRGSLTQNMWLGLNIRNMRTGLFPAHLVKSASEKAKDFVDSDDDDDAPTVWQQKRNQRAQRQAKRI